MGRHDERPWYEQKVGYIWFLNLIENVKTYLLSSQSPFSSWRESAYSHRQNCKISWVTKTHSTRAKIFLQAACEKYQVCRCLPPDGQIAPWQLCITPLKYFLHPLKIRNWHFFHFMYLLHFFAGRSTSPQEPFICSDLGMWHKKYTARQIMLLWSDHVWKYTEQESLVFVAFSSVWYLWLSDSCFHTHWHNFQLSG